MNTPPTENDNTETPRMWCTGEPMGGQDAPQPWEARPRIEGWDGFQQRYAEWLAPLRDPDVLYMLDPELIEYLAEPSLSTAAAVERYFSGLAEDFNGKVPEDLVAAEGGGRVRPPLLTKEQKKAELALYELCTGHHTDCVGVAYGVPVLYMFLGTPLPLPEVTQEQIDDLKWEEVVQTKVSERTMSKELRDANERGTQIRRQLAAYAGKLIATEEFRRERDRLREDWLAMSDTVRMEGPFALPLRRLNYLTPEERTRYAEMGGGFLGRLEAFLAKWSLTAMTTWDLPHPQGPLEAIPAAAAEHLTGRPPVIAYRPPYYQVPTKQDLHKEVRERQEREARDLDQPGDFPPRRLVTRGGEEAGYARALRMYYTEVAYRHRYGDMRGLKTRFAEIFRDLWSISPERVRQLRQLYVAALD